MITAHTLGFPRIGARREAKKAVEAYWKGELDRAGLAATGRALRLERWRAQAGAGLDLVAVGDFSWYDHVLDTTALLGAVPARFGQGLGDVELDTLFRMARGRAPSGADAAACEMTKWFDTNYHYLVPELSSDLAFRVAQTRPFDEVTEAVEAGYRAKPVLLGPLTWLWLGKGPDATFDKLALLPRLVPVYADILARFAHLGVEWVQVDEPILALDLPAAWQRAFAVAYRSLAAAGPKVLVATYFGALGDNLKTACALPVDGLHVDLVRAPEQLEAVLTAWPTERVLSLGVVDGRNVWRTDPDRALPLVARAVADRGENAWVATSCSLLHAPVDVTDETRLDPELRSWLAFAVQKAREVAVLARANDERAADVATELTEARAAAASRRASTRIHRADVAARAGGVTEPMARRGRPYRERRARQAARLGLPLLPTTTIGSFPQTAAVRKARADWKAHRLDTATYEARMREEIAHVVRVQEELGLDVLVHGEAERNDMVEHFAEHLDGVLFTSHGWVQSYGSRYVKPPVIFGDVSRSGPMTVAWSAYAQSLTPKPLKGMLTGPVTILKWSFVRDDQPLSATALQLALALRDEVQDLERAGLRVIQIDEPAFREALPLRRAERAAYLAWAGKTFRVAAAGAADDTQIHTHMCYAEFNDTIEAIAALDADVISIEASRSGMELLGAFERFQYPNEIGPGVYDVHTPVVPTTPAMVGLLLKAAARIPADRLWVNPDCGLKTRDWPETLAALTNLVEAARQARAELTQGPTAAP